ncbi:DUF7373 family lipoprotein [Nocardia aurantiaca]|uniref:Lipoprotein n=1 Tax=Nocardia aurantiaca TaxID=2675850 RepID=A0A6I3KVP8_9NOCA|nr:hypothetical protein [Nocardia aurantiaca]MTE11579.1 hypothetical protein [Nocardia aurantiaca]
MKRFGTRSSAGRTIVGTLAIALAAASLSGCGGPASGNPTAREVDVRQFAVGNYPTDPLDVRSTFHHEATTGKAIALARLADSVVVGPDVDPQFNHNALALSMDSLATAKATQVLAGAVQPALESNGMMFGFSAAASTRAMPKSRQRERPGNFNPFDGAQSDTEASVFNVTVLQFPDPQRAQTAAEQMEAADFAVAADQNVRITLDKQPTAKAHWRPGVPSMAATMAYGQYAVNVYVAQPKPDLDGLRGLAEKVFAAQLPLLDKAPALSPHEIFRLDYDPDGMLRRTLHPKAYYRPHPVSEATHTPRGHLHYADDQATWKQLMDDNGVDRVSTASYGGLLFRARDTEAAAKLWAGIKGTTSDSVEAPANIPDVACSAVPTEETGVLRYAYDPAEGATVYLCSLHYDRYVARVASPQLVDAQQKAAAQYALLANSQFM